MLTLDGFFPVHRLFGKALLRDSRAAAAPQESVQEFARNRLEMRRGAEKIKAATRWRRPQASFR